MNAGPSDVKQPRAVAHKDIYVLYKLSIWLCIIFSVIACETHSEAHLAMKGGLLS